jgi:hypothetical protein
MIANKALMLSQIFIQICWLSPNVMIDLSKIRRYATMLLIKDLTVLIKDMTLCKQPLFRSK